MSIFEKASRLKLRFETARQSITVEDLWDLPLEQGAVNLNAVAQIVNRDLQESGEENFVSKKSESDAVHQLKLEIVKYVISVRLAEKEAKANAAATRERNELILELIAKKQNQELEGKSVEELKAMLGQ